MAGHPQLVSTGFFEDQFRWLTEQELHSEMKSCDSLRAEYQSLDSGKQTPVFLRYSKRKIATCSFADYTLQNGEIATMLDMEACSDGIMMSDELSRPVFDEMVIWEHTFQRIRGITLPEVLALMQPSGKIIVSVRESVDVTYSAYNHFGPQTMKDVDREEFGPEHFAYLVDEMIEAWTKFECTPANYRTRLPKHLVDAGSWFARGMYSRYLKAWLGSFDCQTQVHIFDVSADPSEEVQRLFTFMGVPDESTAREVTKDAYVILSQQETEDDSVGRAVSSGKRENTFMNKRSHMPMYDETRARLEVRLSHSSM